MKTAQVVAMLQRKNGVICNHLRPPGESSEQPISSVPFLRQRDQQPSGRVRRPVNQTCMPRLRE